MAKKTKTKRRILMAKVSFLSLCPVGANTIRTMYKSDDGKDHNIALTTIVKEEMSEQGELFAVVYAPDLTDSDGDVATAQVIKEMAYDFAVNGTGIDIRHNEKVLSPDDAFIAESFIIQKGDPRFADMEDYAGNPVDVTGGWGVVLKINNEDLRTQYREGKWGGISMGGLMLAQNENMETSNLLKSFINLIKNMTSTNKAESPMIEDKDKKEIITSVTKAVTESLLKAAETKVTKSKETPGSERNTPAKGMGYTTPVLKENPTKEDIDNHRKNLRIFNLSKAVDSTDLDSLNKFEMLKERIIKGDEDVTDISSTGDTPFDAFRTNQEMCDVSKGGSAGGSDDYSIALLALMDKEDKATKS